MNYTLLISSCDRRIKLLKLLSYSLNKYFPSGNRRYILETYGSKLSQYHNNYYPNVITVGKVDWSIGMLKALNRINTKYILFMCDDYWLTSPVNCDIIDEYVKLMEEQALSHIRLIPSIKEATESFRTDLQVFKKDAVYITSMNAGLWNVEILKSLLRPGENIWTFESHGSNRARSNHDKFFCTKEWILKYGHNFSHDRYTQEAYDYCKKEELSETDYLT